MPWKNNEDAGDLHMQNAADASEYLDEEECEECGEDFEYCECNAEIEPDEPDDYYDGPEVDYIYEPPHLYM